MGDYSGSREPRIRQCGNRQSRIIAIASDHKGSVVKGETGEFLLVTSEDEPVTMPMGTVQVLFVNKSYTVEDLIALIGQPHNTDYSDPEHIYLIYDHFYINFIRYETSGTTNILFGSVCITDPSFVLWRGNIRIGSTKDDVARIYGSFKSEMGIYYDLYWHVSFQYDENNTVKAIILS